MVLLFADYHSLITAYQFHPIAQTLLGLIDAVRFFQPDHLEDGVTVCWLLRTGDWLLYTIYS